MQYRLYHKVIYLTMTFGVYGIFLIKMSLNQLLTNILTIIIGVGIVLSINPLQTAYITMTLVIIFVLFLDNILRGRDKKFDMINTIFQPIDLNSLPSKYLVYNKYEHATSTAIFLIFEIIKIFSSIYCIIGLYYGVPDQGNNYVIYWILSCVLLESLAGVILYLPLFFLIFYVQDLFYHWVTVLGQWYLTGSVTTHVTLIGNEITMTIVQG